MITKEKNRIICSSCGYFEKISKSTFNKMLKFSWVKWLSNAYIEIPLTCPKCRNKTNEYFLFN